MYIKTAIWHKLLFLIAVQLFSSQVLANCSDSCQLERRTCLKNSSYQQNLRCEEQFDICTLSCNRQENLACVYLGFKNHDGIADKEMELKERTGGFARVTEESKSHFSGLCSSNNMRCEYVLNWDGRMYSCGGEKREPRRVACCR